MRTFCTLFDKNYLYQGVALHNSLLRHAGDFELYALCMDDAAYALLDRMDCATLIPLRVDDVMTPELELVRQRTTHGQFCWVCQPVICAFLLNRGGADMVTYLESDSMFFSSPEPLFEELGERSVSLVPHNFSPNLDNAAAAGRFCVQFNAFRNDAAARSVLASWKQDCFKYHKSAPYAYPGQTCLDTWPERFKAVAVIRHPGAGVAPWNIRGYELAAAGSVPYVNGAPAVFFHYHQYGRFKNGDHELGSYPLSREVVDAFYRPYVAELRAVERTVCALDSSFTYRREYSERRSLKDRFSALKRRLRGRYNVYPNAYFSVDDRSAS